MQLRGRATSGSAVVDGARPRLPPRVLQMLAAYAYHGSIKVAAECIGISHQYGKNLITISHQRLDVPSTIDAFRELGWLTTPSQCHEEPE